MDLILVGVGGFFGSLCRFQLGRLIARTRNTTFPIGTFFINITGAFLLGVLSSLNLSKGVYPLLGDGFLGAYTTFSTFMYEGFHLFEDRETLNALVYILGSLITGAAGFAAGFALGRAFS